MKLNTAVTVIAVVIALVSTATAVHLYTAPKPPPPPQRPVVAAPSPDSDMKARMIAAQKLQAAAQDKWLTGDANGHAEWRPMNAGFYTRCGVTPDARYLIANNEIGKSRYDEPATGNKAAFEKAWSDAQCEASSPTHQAFLLREMEDAREAREREADYSESHPTNPECLIAEMRANAGSGEYHLEKNKHYCQDGSYERDQGIAGR